MTKGFFTMIPQRVTQRSTAPRYLANLAQVSFSLDLMNFYLDPATGKIQFSCPSNTDWKIGMTDLVLELFELTQSLPSEREVVSFLKDNAYQDFPLAGSEQEVFLKNLILHINRQLFQQNKAALVWTSASMVEKLNAVKAIVAMHYKGVELIDVDDDTVVVNLGQSGKCEGDKILESLQDYLQIQLKSHKINVIPEF
jgi:hypothetical protein